MAGNDAADVNDRRRQILEAALKVFSTKGFERATNKDIAEAAGGISPGLIYHYFKDKQDLLFSILQERAPIVQLAARPEQLMSLPPHEGLTIIGRAYLGAARVPGNLAVVRILVGEALRFPQIAEMIYKGAVQRIFGLVSSYLERQVQLGRLRPHDTGIATRSFIGQFIAHIIAREFLHQPEALAVSDDDMVAAAVDLFLKGLEVA
ncbi:MAG: TetR/AcrR family transcriptional regulator [Chloroflexaceae bacterium]|jgi:AcrR family transcriptional regulator|nr:TetR/AcrR family transcriptional regulator [Chloroflexaceae bacterium]